MSSKNFNQMAPTVITEKGSPVVSGCPVDLFAHPIPDQGLQFNGPLRSRNALQRIEKCIEHLSRPEGWETQEFAKFCGIAGGIKGAVPKHLLFHSLLSRLGARGYSDILC